MLQPVVNRRPIEIAIAHRLSPCSSRHLSPPRPTRSGCVNDRYSRSHDYDLVHQRIELRDFNWDSSSFEGVVTTTLRSLKPGTRLGRARRGGAAADLVESVSGAGGPGAALLAGTAILSSSVSRRAVAFGDTVRFRMTYHGRVENGRGLTFIEADSDAAPAAAPALEPGRGRQQPPLVSDLRLSQRQDDLGSLATVPRGFTAVSNGRLLLDRRIGTAPAPSAGARSSRRRPIWSRSSWHRS